MHDSELRKILQQTCPVRPGQEGRAWASLQERLDQGSPVRSWSYGLTWRGAAVAFPLVFALIAFGLSLSGPSRPKSYATAASEAPGIYATSYYSSSAHAQVIWLKGLDPVTDQPTYLDPTAPLGRRPTENSRPTGKPNSL